MFATQLLRHPSLRPMPLAEMYAAHPRVTRGGKTFVPAVHVHPVHGPSIFLYPFSKFAYADRILADGRTIEYHPSRNALIDSDIASLVGREVVLYAQAGRAEGRVGRVRVSRSDRADVYLLELQPQPDVDTKGVAAVRVAWADMD